jgi:mono/diheme cytochrome c family protein
MEDAMRAHPALQGLAMAVVIGVAEASAQVPATAQSPERGEHGSSIFRTYCASCHGETGRGDGPLAQSLRRPPPDLTGIAARHQGVFPAEKVYRIIDGRERVPGHGGPDMPVWGDAFMRSGEATTRESVNTKIRRLVEFLDSIQRRIGQ